MKTIKIPPYIADKISRKPEDFNVEFTRGSGKGGQNRNKRETAVKITDIATGVSSYCCDERSQLQNKRTAFSRLIEKLIKYYEQEHRKENPKQYEGPPEVRVYNEKRNTIKDHRTNGVYDFKETLEGKLDPILLDLQIKLGLTEG